MGEPVRGSRENKEERKLKGGRVLMEDAAFHLLYLPGLCPAVAGCSLGGSAHHWMFEIVATYVLSPS